MNDKRTRRCELIVNVSRLLEGTIKDWPANIQDGVYKALADKSQDAKCNFVIVASRADYDVDEGPYIHVVAEAEVTLQ